MAQAALVALPGSLTATPHHQAFRMSFSRLSPAIPMSFQFFTKAPSKFMSARPLSFLCLFLSVLHALPLSEEQQGPCPLHSLSVAYAFSSLSLSLSFSSGRLCVTCREQAQLTSACGERLPWPARDSRMESGATARVTRKVHSHNLQAARHGHT